MNDPDCVFCNIAAGEILSEKIYEDDRLLAFADIRPIAPGHTLLIPKEHYPWFYELPDELSDYLFRTAKSLARQLKEKHDAHLVKLSIVGDQVPHTHLHLIPLGASDTPRI